MLRLVRYQPVDRYLEPSVFCHLDPRCFFFICAIILRYAPCHKYFERQSCHPRKIRIPALRHLSGFIIAQFSVFLKTRGGKK